MAKLSSTHIYGDLYVDGTINGALSGNASTATTLQTARTINGTSFNGSANITTTNWGTARTITIGSTGKSVNGSGNVSWSLDEIGAAAKSHGTHLTLGTGSGNAYRGDYGNTAYTHSQAAHAPSNAQKNSDITKAEIEAKLTGNITSHTHSAYAAASHGTHVRSSAITTGYDTTFRTKTKGDANSGSYFSTVRTDTASVNYAPQYGSGIAWGQGDTHGYLNVSYSSATAYLGGGSSDKLNWVKQIAFSDHNHDSTYAKVSHGTHLTIGTGASNAAAGNHTHNYAGSSSSGGAANSVKTNLIIKLNGGSTEGTNLFTFNGGTAKTVNITPSAIGAAASSHGTHLSLGTTSSTAYRGDYGNTAYNHSQAAHAPSNAQKNSDITKAEIEAKLTGTVTSHNHSGTYAPASHNHTSLTGITSLSFATESSDSSTITSSYSSSTSYMDFNMSDDAGSDMWRWRFTAWDTNAGASATTFNAMTLQATSTTKSQLVVNGNVTADSFTEGGTALSSKYAPSSHSHNSFNIKGNDTITSTSNDTTANWGNHNNSVHFYTTAGQLIDQPSTWGYLLNIGKTNEVHQIWMTQASGDMFHRGGNANGWNGSWRKLLDSSNWSSYAAPSSHNHTQLTGEVRFPGSGTYTDPWNGISCAIKATGNVGITGTFRANTGIYSTSGNGVATADGSTYVALFRYKENRGYCDLGSNTVPGRIYVRSGQGTAGSGVLVECAVTNGNAYMQYLSPEAGTIALTRHLSDRTRKDNIVYVDSKDSEFTNKDFYDFIKNDLGLATYNLKKEYASTDTHTKLNFIAQDILWDFEKNEENKVGNLIVQAEDAMDQQLSLKYDPEVFTSVIAGALKESINKIEELEDKNKKLEERLAMLEEKFSALENK